MHACVVFFFPHGKWGQILCPSEAAVAGLERVPEVSGFTIKEEARALAE